MTFQAEKPPSNYCVTIVLFSEIPLLIRIIEVFQIVLDKETHTIPKSRDSKEIERYFKKAIVY